MSRGQLASLPSLEQYAKLLSAHEDEDFEVKKPGTPNTLGQAPIPNGVRSMKLPIPKHLLMLKKKSTNPIGRKRVGKGGWRNITAGSVADYGVKAWQLAKHLATLINVEEKVWDVDGSSGTALTSTATVVNLSNIAQGSDYVNRQGDSILAQSIEFRGVLSGSPSTANHRARILIVRDKLQRGVDPVIGDVLQGGTDPTQQPYLEPQENRFDVLYDEVVVLDHVPGLATTGTSTTYVVRQAQLPHMKRKFNQHIKYQGTTGVDASNWIGGLYLMAICLDASNGPNLRYTFRLRFTDN